MGSKFRFTFFPFFSLCALFYIFFYLEYVALYQISYGALPGFPSCRGSANERTALGYSSVR